MALQPRRFGHLLTRIVFVTQQVDRAHPVLAATVPKIAALAERVDEVVVLADGAVPGMLPDELPRPALRRAPSARPRRAVRGRRSRPSSAPAAGGRSRTCARSTRCSPRRSSARSGSGCCSGTRTGTPRRRCALAERVSTVVVCVDRRSFPLESAKVVRPGTGSTSRVRLRDGAARRPTFARSRSAATRRRRGWRRSSGAVGLALARARPTRSTSTGRRCNAEERAHRDDARAARAELDLGKRVQLGDADPALRGPGALRARRRARQQHARRRAGQGRLRGVRRCLPVLASNPAFDDLLTLDELRFAARGPGALADRLVALGALPPRPAHELGRTLRERVGSRHSSSTWADGILAGG